MKHTFIITRISLLTSFLLLSSLSIAQQDSWVNTVEWKTFEEFKKNKEKKISLIYIEQAQETKRPLRANTKKIQEILNNYNYTKLKLENQEISFKGQIFKKIDDTQTHQFRDYLIGNSINENYMGPVIVILDKEFNYIEFKLVEFDKKEEQDINEILLAAEKIKLDFLKENIKSENNEQIKKQEFIVDRLTKSNQRNNESKSIFNATRYSNNRLEHLLNYFSKKEYKKNSLRDYLQMETKKKPN